MVLRQMKYILLLAVAVMPVAHCASYVSNGFLTAYPSSDPGRDPGLGMTISFGWPTAEEPDISLPCYDGRRGCWLGPVVTLDTPANPRGYLPWDSQMTVQYVNGEMLSTVRNRWIKRFGISGTIEEMYWGTANEGTMPYLHTALGCFQYWATPGSGWNDGSIGINLPGTQCGTLAPPNVTCESLPSMVYDFGTVAAGQTSGLRKSQRQTLSCTNATSVSLRLSSDLKLSQNVSAHISVNGRRLDTTGVTVPIQGNATPLDFVVTTNGNESDAGAYAASSVLIMEYR
ncbi:Uncharacterised protein [Serratia fonticola]|nr:Uncharacterised protein [Serratia fonticola]